MDRSRVQIPPDVARLLEVLGPAGVPVSAQAARQTSPLVAELKGPPERVDSVKDLTIDGPGGPLRLRFYRPAIECPPVLVYLHGGGWVLGDLDIQDGLCRALANRVGCAVLSVDYRLAPEHPHPAAVDDAGAAFVWAATKPAELGVTGPTGIAGDSAGGNLAAVVALAARDGQGPAPALCALICPITEHRESDSSLAAFAEGFFLTAERMRWYWDQYAPDGIDRLAPELSPLRADLAGLCPTVVVTAGFDPLRDQGLDFVHRCGLDGVELVHLHHPATIHGFLGFQASLGRARPALDELALVLRHRFEQASRSLRPS